MTVQWRHHVGSRFQKTEKEKSHYVFRQSQSYNSKKTLSKHMRGLMHHDRFSHIFLPTLLSLEKEAAAVNFRHRSVMNPPHAWRHCDCHHRGVGILAFRSGINGSFFRVPTERNNVRLMDNVALDLDVSLQDIGITITDDLLMMFLV